MGKLYLSPFSRRVTACSQVWPPPPPSPDSAALPVITKGAKSAEIVKIWEFEKGKDGEKMRLKSWREKYRKIRRQMIWFGFITHCPVSMIPIPAKDTASLINLIGLFKFSC